MRSNVRVVGATLCALVLLSGCSVADLPNPWRRATPAPAVPIDLPAETQAQLREYDTAVRLVRESYANSKALDGGWLSVVGEERTKVARGLDDIGFYTSLRVVFGAVGDPDLTVSPPETASAGSGQFAGIGVRIDLPREGRDRILILHVYPGSPAERSGLRAHDAIVAIEGAPVRFAERDTVVSRLRGTSGSDVSVTVRTPGQAPRDVRITRRAITPSETTSSQRLPNTNVAYIRPGVIAGDVMRSDVIDALRKLQTDAHADGLILDLRTMQSPDFPLEGMLNLFVNGDVGARASRESRAAEKIDVVGKNIGGSQVLPLAVLVSEFTVGPAESFAGVLQDLGRAKIVGSTTAGRTAVLSRATLPGSGLVLTLPTGDVRGPKNRSWLGVGVTPDVVTGRAWESFNQDNDADIAGALSSLAGK